MRQKKSRPSRLKAVLSDLTRSPVTLADIDTELAEIKQMWTLLIGMRQALAKDSGITEPPPSPPGADRAMLHGAVIKRKNSRHPPPTEPIRPLQLVAGSSADAVYQILDRAAGPMTYPELRDEYAKTEAGKSMQPHEKPYYYGVQRLKMSGHVVLYKGKLWASHHLEKFRKDVAAGLARDMEDQPVFHGRWADAVLNCVRAHGDWISTNEVAAHIETLPEFKDNKNVISQVCLALRNLNYRHKLLDRKGNGRGRGSLWRAITTNADTADEVIARPENERATKGLPSVARH